MLEYRLVLVQRSMQEDETQKVINNSYTLSMGHCSIGTYVCASCDWCPVSFFLSCTTLTCQLLPQAVLLCGGMQSCTALWWYAVLYCSVVVCSPVLLCGGMQSCTALWWYAVLYCSVMVCSPVHEHRFG